MPLSAAWGPYSGPDEARRMLCGFVDHVCDPTVGVHWSANNMLFPIRPPRRDADGYGQVVVFEWPAAPPPIPKPPAGVWAKLKEAVERAMEARVQSDLAIAQGEMQIGAAFAQAVPAVFNNMTQKHQDDGINLALDFVCVALTIGAMASGFGVVALLGFAGGVALLGMDGTAYAYELGGDDKKAEEIKKTTETWRIIATAATLPDIACGSWNALRDISKIKNALSVTRSTAETAETLATRTKNASRAKKYREIAENAYKRAQQKTESIRHSIVHELTPRGAGLGSAGFLVREEWSDNDSVTREIFGRLRIHAMAVR